MAASSVIIALSMLLLVGFLSAATEDNDLNVGAPCVTGKDVPGNCSLRNDCEFNTPAVDLTLYKPKGYKSTCPEKHVCCPARYQVPKSAQPPPEDDDNFSFDDDD